MVPPGERPTLRTIAEQAGTSVMTVSRVLRGFPHVSAEIRERVLAAAAELDYRPDPILAVLNSYRRNKRSQVKGDVLVYLTDWKTEYGWRRYRQLEELYDGIRRRAAELGYLLEHIWLGAPGFRQRTSNILYARGVEGVILGPTQANVGHFRLDWEKFTTVAIGHSVVSPATHVVAPDYFQGAFMAWKTLWRLGYRRIGLAIPRRWELRTRSRWSAAVLKLQESLPVRSRVKALLDMPVDHESRTSEPGFPEFKTWFLKHKPDAVLGMGEGMPRWIEELGCQIPEEVGYVNLDLGISEQNSGIYQQPDFVGEAAVNLLQLRMHKFEKGIPKNPHMIVIGPSWQDGLTTTRVKPSC